MGIVEKTWPPALPELQLEKTESVEECPPAPILNPNQSQSVQQQVEPPTTDISEQPNDSVSTSTPLSTTAVEPAPATSSKQPVPFDTSVTGTSGSGSPHQTSSSTILQTRVGSPSKGTAARIPNASGIPGSASLPLSISSTVGSIAVGGSASGQSLGGMSGGVLSALDSMTTLGSPAPTNTNLALFGDDGASTPRPSPNVPLFPSSTTAAGAPPNQTLTGNAEDLNVEDMQVDNEPGGNWGDDDDAGNADPSQMEALHFRATSSLPIPYQYLPVANIKS